MNGTKLTQPCFTPLAPAAVARRFFGGSGFFKPRAISASSSRREPVGVPLRSFQARSPLSPLRLDLGAIQRSCASVISAARRTEFFFLWGKKASQHTSCV